MQIGPRIRVGGTAGKIGQKLKIGAGKVAQPLGKVVSLVNPGLGTAISTVGDALDTTDGKFNIGRAAGNAALQYGAGRVLDKIPGVSKVGHAIGDKLGGMVPDAIKSQVQSIGDKLNIHGAGDLIDRAKGAGSDLLGQIPGYVKAHPDAILGGLATLDLANQRRGATDLENRGLNRLQRAYDERAGLRQQGVAGMSRPEEDYGAQLSGVYRPDAGNVYDAPPPVTRARTMRGRRV